MTKTKTKGEKPETTNSRKRKNTRGGKKSTKRRRSDNTDSMSIDDDFIDDDDLDFSDDSDKDSGNDSGSDPDSDDSKSGSDSDDDGNGGENEGEEGITVESLEAKITEAKDAIKAGRVQLSEFRKQRKEASDTLATLKKKQLKAQREKNAFCSLKRSEVCSSVERQC